MSSEKRLVLFLVLSVILMFGTQALMQTLGLVPDPPKPPPVVEAKAKEEVKTTDEPKPVEPPVAPVIREAPAPKEPEVALATVADLTLGSLNDTSLDGYRLRVLLTQGGGGVSTAQLAHYDAEFESGKSRNRPLTLISSRNSKAPAPLSLTLTPRIPGSAVSPAAWPLDSRLWEVVRDSEGKSVKEVTEGGAGQQISFRTTVEDITVTKTFTLRKGQNVFELDITLDSPNSEKLLEYTLMGPHGVPIEGEWYTSTFRDVCFGQVDRNAVSVVTKSAYDVGKYVNEPESLQTFPLQFAGVENQYFTTFLGHRTPLMTQENRLDAESHALLLSADPTKAGKDDVGVSVTSKSLEVGPNRSVTHSWLVYAGPKDKILLAAYGAEGLATYRKNQSWIFIPGGATVATLIIDPMLRGIYALTEGVAKIFGFKNGNYGIAIILLTMTVRMIMFPLGRRSAMMAKKAQDLAPQMSEIKEKFKDDKDRQAKETFALYKREGFNPMSGCWPALIQMPIFVGLWQALNNSVSLRHASFLYIRDLSAPDMLFKFPVKLPLIGDFLGEYFNVLPFIVVALMLVQTKLFQPPAITEEQKQQQSMMKFMMIFMAFMFYKVPSGLGLYFITSSTWQICERLLLPKVKSSTRAASSVVLDVTEQSKTAAPGAAPNAPAPYVDSWVAKIERRLKSYVDEAQGDKTIRNAEASAKARERKDDGETRDRNNRPKPPGKRR